MCLIFSSRFLNNRNGRSLSLLPLLSSRKYCNNRRLRDFSQKRVIFQTWTNVLRLRVLQHSITFPAPGSGQANFISCSLYIQAKFSLTGVQRSSRESRNAFHLQKTPFAIGMTTAPCDQHFFRLSYQLKRELSAEEENK